MIGRGSAQPRVSTLQIDQDLNLYGFKLKTDAIAESTPHAGISVSDLLLLTQANISGESSVISAAISQLYCTVAASDNTLKATVAAEESTTNETATFICNLCTVPAGVLGSSNSLRIVWQQMINWVSSTGYVAVYVDGIQATEYQTVTGDANWHVKSVDVPGVEAGNVLSLWGYISNNYDGTKAVTIKNRVVRGTETISTPHTPLTWS